MEQVLQNHDSVLHSIINLLEYCFKVIYYHTMKKKLNPHQKTRDEKKYEALLEGVRQRVAVRNKDKKAKTNWQTRYLESFQFDPHPNRQVAACTNGIGNGLDNSIFNSNWKRTYADDPLLAEREADAMKIAESKKKQIGISYNKGPYQPLTRDTQLSSLGKK